MKEQMEALMPGQYLFGEIEKRTIAEQAFYAMDVVLQQSDREEIKTVYQTYLTMRKGDRTVQSVLALDQEQMEMMISGFSKPRKQGGTVCIPMSKKRGGLES